MCVTIGTGLAIAAIGTSAATSAYAAHKQSENVQSANQMQQTAAEKALTLQQDRYQQSRQDFDPYKQAGAASIGRLSSLSAAPRQSFDPSKPGGGFQAPNPLSGFTGSQMAPNPVQQPPGATMQPQGAPVGGSPPMAPQGPPQGQQAGMVMMSLNGQSGPVPQQLVPLLTARGGRVIG